MIKPECEYIDNMVGKKQGQTERVVEKENIIDTDPFMKGFTLIELLVVVLIVSILASLVTLSINVASPSEVSKLKAKIQQHIALVQNHVQLYNQPIHLKVSKDKMQALSFQPEINKGKEKVLSEKPLWQPSQRLNVLNFKLRSVVCNVEIIKILPNGFITDATIILSQDGESVTFKAGVTLKAKADES
ncbi:MAG: prepilin-type N-terminal cleavage/methylation domain-containing protein [Gammaproteobacteria bacterium]|nr:prepilin-type N-terminal cleavage/methylation domain-containing protein [Gammaproteobacteria bacterium]